MDPKRRFSGRAGNYERCRPGYPAEVLTFIEAACGLSKTSVVADVGSGTGLLSGLFLENGYRVFGVEPNREMREAAERRLGSCPRFRSVAAAAEATALPAASVDLVTCGNSFHWFDVGPARAEFSRVLKPDGRVAVLLNAPAKTGTPLLEAREWLLSEHASDGGGRIGVYESIEDLYRGVEAFFGDGGYETARFRSARRLAFEGLKGLMFSYSNMPAEGGPGSAALLRDLETVFRDNESRGRVAVEYVALVYCGRPGWMADPTRS